MDAASGCARFTGFGAAIATTCFGGAGASTGFGVSIFTTGFGGSGALISGSLIFGGSTFAICGTGLGGTIFGLGRSGFFSAIGMINCVILRLFWIVSLVAAALRITITHAATQLTTSEVTVDVLLWPPVSRTPKCVNCMLFASWGFALRSGAAIAGTIPLVALSQGRIEIKFDAI